MANDLQNILADWNSEDIGDVMAEAAEAQARADAARDERDLEREISKLPWPR